MSYIVRSAKLFTAMKSQLAKNFQFSCVCKSESLDSPTSASDILKSLIFLLLSNLCWKVFLLQEQNYGHFLRSR